MSYWSHHVGPFWSHVFQTLNPFGRQQVGILEQNLLERPQTVPDPALGALEDLLPRHAPALQAFLQKEYVKFPRSQVSLSEERIRQGFQLDGWTGLAYQIQGEIVGCIFSRPLGTLFTQFQEIPRVALIDFFCVAKAYRKKGIASYLLQEFTRIRAAAGALVHVFQIEGGFFRPLPPLYQGRYIWRQRGLPSEAALFLRKIDISPRQNLKDMIHFRYMSEDNVRTLPSHMTGDSEIYIFQYRSYWIFMCITDTFHRSKPENWKIGEILWLLPKETETPKEIQRLAIETLVDNCSYDIVLMDSSNPHDSRRAWKKDESYSWHITNFHPGRFMDVKPYFIL